MKARAFAITLAIGLVSVALGAGAMWRSAVPRVECDWETQFCSDYGPLYGGIAVVAALTALCLAYVALTRKSSK